MLYWFVLFGLVWVSLMICFLVWGEFVICAGIWLFWLILLFSCRCGFGI